MDFLYVPVPWQVALPCLVLALWCLVRAWRGESAKSVAEGWIAPVVALAIVFVGWSLGPKLGAEFQVRFLSSALLTLLFGYARAVILLALVMLSHAAWQGPSLTAFATGIGPDLLVHAIGPAALMSWLCLQVKQRLPRNPLCFMLGCGLFAACLTLIAQWLVSTGLVMLLAPERSAALLEALPYSLLFSWGEAFMGGMAITVLSVFHPSAVALYDEEHFLPHPPSTDH